MTVRTLRLAFGGESDIVDVEIQGRQSIEEEGW